MVDITDKYRKLVGKNKFNIFEGSREEMEKLGKKWMKDDEFHEVISFPIDEIYGDVVVWEGVTDKKFLVEHGVRHLLGEHHD